MIPFVDLKIQYLSIKNELLKAVDGVFEKSWFVLGERVETFEKEFASYCGAMYGVGVGSGTEALHLALRACGVRYGDQVVTVPNTAVPTASAITQAGATPVFIDIETSTYIMDIERLRDKLKREIDVKNNKRIKAIIPVHLYGHPADMDPIIDVAGEYGLSVIEDACQAHGAEYKGKKVGSLGDFGCFSFYPSKNLGAYGDGGIVITNNSEHASKLKLMRNYGQIKRYYHTVKGFNSRLDEIQAAMLLVKLKYLDTWNEMRRGKARIYDKMLSEDKVIKPCEADYGKHIYHLYVIRHKERDKLRSYLAENEVGALIHYPVPIHLQKAYEDLRLKEGALPVAEMCCNEILSLPMFPELKENDIERVCDLVNRL